MAAKLRNTISRMLPESQKYRISMLGSFMTYKIAAVMKGLSPLWEEDPEFNEIYAKVQTRILLDQARCHVLLQLSRRQRYVTGNIAELGAYRCGASLFLTGNDNAPGKTLHIIDSFAGLPEVGAKDPFWKKGEMGLTDFTEIQGFLKANLLNTPYVLHRGFFPQEISLDSLRNPWSLVHIDTDLYQPTLDALNFFYPLLSIGGVILVDDFGNSSCPGVVSAVREFEAENKVQSIYLISGQAIFLKHC